MIFFTCREGEEKLEEFLNRLNNFHPNLKFTYEKTDVSVNNVDKKLETDLYSKPTD